MNDKLWAGADFKLESTAFHFRKMGQMLEPASDAWSIAAEVSGAIVDTGWERSFYPHLDAFLSAARRIPEIIRCCFGTDTFPAMQAWLRALPQDEQDRRQEFTRQFEGSYDAFRALPLGEIRHISQHRTGLPSATVTITGVFGMGYVSSAVDRVPLSETRQIDDPDLAHLAKPRRIHPVWSDFELEGQPLYSCVPEIPKRCPSAHRGRAPHCPHSARH